LIRIVVLLVAATILGLGSAWPESADAGGPDDPLPGATGTVEGVLRGASAPPRRVAPRYPGAGGGPARTVQRIPPVVYVRGPIGGGAGGGGGSAPPVIAQEDTAFAPALRIVTPGTTVEFPNRDPFFHNVFSYSPSARFDLGRYPRGESKSVTFDEPGVVKIYCEVHDFMRSAVVVVENPFHARPDGDGRFRISGVPAGRHTLVAWHADRGTVEREVTVPDGGTVRVELEL